ncbi:MAG: hypothetical protein ACLSAC_10070 [Enterocloster bolteae]
MLPLEGQRGALRMASGAATARRHPGRRSISLAAFGVMGKRPFNTPCCQMASGPGGS